VVGVTRADGDVPSLEELVLRAGRGDRSAFAAFFDRTAPVVLRFAHFALGRARAREQMVRAVYLTSWVRAAKFDSADGGAVAWLLDTCYQEIDALTAHRPRPF
jgi:RNA polymerase sigma-70 factor (ECF subfamily)